ncbi:porin family protein [Aurantibacillus circumpalustris]|uniref:porin family protein n=1 Tax=Aurantibacillus circumpalustris TaxID=3036359 RepID=UPI00295B8042|nr:porin family protein [Aurantibacillus circumpalustris]
MRYFSCIFLFLVLIGKGQQSEVFALKPSLGLNGCQVHGDNYSGYKKLGIFGGLAVNARLGEKFSLELGFYFSQKGARKNPGKDDYDYYRLNLNYIDLPLSLRYMLNKRYFITLGPSLAYLVNYNENINYTDVTGQYKFKKYEVGLNIGLGRTVIKNLSVEVRFSNSITSVRDYGVVSNVFYPNPVARFFNKGFYNNILTVMFSYQFGKLTSSEDN